MSGREYRLTICNICGLEAPFECEHMRAAKAGDENVYTSIRVFPESRVEALKARLRQEVDAHHMTLHPHALPFTDEEWQGYLGTIPGLEEGT